jgi:hypothetical protein
LKSMLEGTTEILAAASSGLLAFTEAQPERIKEKVVDISTISTKLVKQQAANARADAANDVPRIDQN